MSINQVWKSVLKRKKKKKRSKKDVKDGALYLECLNKDHQKVGGVDQNGTVIWGK